MAQKKCPKCKEAKPENQFCKRQRNRDGLDDWCRLCKKLTTDKWRRKNRKKGVEYTKQWQQNNPEKALRLKRLYRERHPDRVRVQVQTAHQKYGRQRYQPGRWRRLLMRKYGITEQEYLGMLERQGGVCAICKNGQSCGDRQNLYVDHCHQTNRVRGLLCMKCNTVLGMLGDDTSVLVKAVRYLNPLQGGSHD